MSQASSASTSFGSSNPFSFPYPLERMDTEIPQEEEANGGGGGGSFITREQEAKAIEDKFLTPRSQKFIEDMQRLTVTDQFSPPRTEKPLVAPGAPVKGDRTLNSPRFAGTPRRLFADRTIAFSLRSSPIAAC